MERSHRSKYKKLFWVENNHMTSVDGKMTFTLYVLYAQYGTAIRTYRKRVSLLQQ